MVFLPQPYLLFLGDATEELRARTAFALRDWAPERCIGEFALPAATVTTGLPQLTPGDARQRRANALVIGVEPIGGIIAPAWVPALLEALESGLDLIGGSHARLDDISVLQMAAERWGRRLIDVRRSQQQLPVASGYKRSGQRLLTVGTDRACGKTYTALALTRAFKQRGVHASFRATGETGIMIAGAGIPLGAIAGDFIAGAAEQLSPNAPTEHWDVVEGQGSLFHPSLAGVSLGLLHGTQPDVIVICHEAGQRSVVGVADFSLPELEEVIELHLRLARSSNPSARCAGISVNTSMLSAAQASVLLERQESRFGLPCADPIRGGATFDELVDTCLGRSR